jgi:hypothetical protein
MSPYAQVKQFSNIMIGLNYKNIMGMQKEERCTNCLISKFSSQNCDMIEDVFVLVWNQRQN